MYYLLKGQERLKFLSTVRSFDGTVNRGAAIRYFIAHEEALLEHLPDVMVDLIRPKQGEDGKPVPTYFMRGMESIETADILSDSPCVYARGVVGIGSELADAWKEAVAKHVDAAMDDIQRDLNLTEEAA